MAGPERGPVHVSHPLAEVLERVGISLDELDALGYPRVAAAIRRELAVRGEDAVRDPLQPIEDAADHAAPREAPTLRLVR